MKAKDELQRIRDDVPSTSPTRTFDRGSTRRVPRFFTERISQPGGAKGQVHLDGHGNDQRLRATRWVNERLRRSRSHSRATREVQKDGLCESNDEFNKIVS